jgi:hypothetical protein
VSPTIDNWEVGSSHLHAGLRAIIQTRVFRVPCLKVLSLRRRPHRRFFCSLRVVTCLSMYHNNVSPKEPLSDVHKQSNESTVEM